MKKNKLKQLKYHQRNAGLKVCSSETCIHIHAISVLKINLATGIFVKRFCETNGNVKYSIE